MELRLAVLLSGSGRTLQNLLDRRAAGRLSAEVVLVVSSHRKAFGLERAEQAGIPSLTVRRPDAASEEDYTARVFAACREAGADLVCLAGFLKRLRPIPADFRGKVLNIHPSLLPSFGGKGYYGDRVHQSALSHGVRVSGCTVHVVDDEYDHGPIVLQRTVPVLPDDDVRSLANRVFQIECEAYPEAIELFAQGRVELAGRQVRIRDRP